MLAWVRRAPEQTLVALHNMSDSWQIWPRGAVPLPDPLRDALTGERPARGRPGAGAVRLPWLVRDAREG